MSDTDESNDFYSDPRKFFAFLPEDDRPVAYLTEDEAVVAVKQALDELFFIYDRLHHIVQLNESIIRKRWTKVGTQPKANSPLIYTVVQRPQAKRRALLLEIFPKIPRNHAPEVQAFKKAGKSHKLQTQRDDFLFPFANLEDLCSEGGAKCMIQVLSFPLQLTIPSEM
jgi:hypothetical protein